MGIPAEKVKQIIISFMASFKFDPTSKSYFFIFLFLRYFL